MSFLKLIPKLICKSFNYEEKEYETFANCNFKDQFAKVSYSISSYQNIRYRQSEQKMKPKWGMFEETHSRMINSCDFIPGFCGLLSHMSTHLITPSWNKLKNNNGNVVVAGLEGIPIPNWIFDM